MLFRKSNCIGLQLNLSKEIIQNNINKILEKDAIEKAEQKRQDEIDCEKSFKLVAELVMKAKDTYQYIDIPSRDISKCSNFNNFVKLMNENNIKVSAKRYTDSASYSISKNEQSIYFS